MNVDRATLLVFGYNHTRLDVSRSRSFGVVTTNRKTVQDGRHAVRGRLRETSLQRSQERRD